jgi:hypothetical protein
MTRKWNLSGSGLHKERRGSAAGLRLGNGEVTLDTWKAQHLQPRALDEVSYCVSAGQGCSKCGAGAEDAFALDAPCTLRLAPCPRRGALDLQLQLLSLQLGCSEATSTHGRKKLPGACDLTATRWAFWP